VIGTIENAILARLRAASEAGALGYKYTYLGSYPTDWDEYLKDTQIRCPAAWVTFGGWSVSSQSKAGAQVKASFGLVVASMNHRNEVATRQGVETTAGREVGSYQMIMDAASLLSNHSLGLDISPLEMGNLQFVRPFAAILERKWSMMALQFETTFSIAAASDPASGLGDFSRFFVDWDLSPSDGAIEAQDHILLPQVTP
jgi:phage gp37-like protein